MRKRPLWNDFAVNERDGDISALLIAKIVSG